ncbi:MAG TPA: DUF6760 family protein [Chloroflexota bacterium]
MPQLLHRGGGGYYRAGGVARYPLDRVYEEVAYIAYHFHWADEAILGMSHQDRRRWVEEIDQINRRRNAEDEQRITSAFKDLR